MPLGQLVSCTWYHYLLSHHVKLMSTPYSGSGTRNLLMQLLLSSWAGAQRVQLFTVIGSACIACECGLTVTTQKQMQHMGSVLTQTFNKTQGGCQNMSGDLLCVVSPVDVFA